MEKEKKRRTVPYNLALKEILSYQIATKMFVAAIMAVLNKLAMFFLYSTGRVAISSGDFVPVLLSWQGIVLLLITLVVLLVYLAFDLNAMVIMSDHILKGETVKLEKLIRESFSSLRHFISVDGLGVTLYFAFLSPILGVGVSMSLTRKLYIPTFITSVIKSTPLYYAAYVAAVVFFVVLGILNLFILHGTALDGLTVRESSRQSRRLMRAHWPDYLKKVVRTFLQVVFIFLVIVGRVFLSFALARVLVKDVFFQRFSYLMVCFIYISLTGLYVLAATPMYMLRMTALYRSYTQEGWEPSLPIAGKRRPLLAVVTLAALALIAGVSAIISYNFDEFLRKDVSVGVIAHRGGGAEGAENTVAGLEKAYSLGAMGSEIDIQRTADGAYVVNHDSNFARTAGVKKTPGEMTLEEISELRVDGEPVATYEEMLEASKGRVTLFVELKGASADRKMADDAVRIIKEHGMEDQAVLISLKYDLIDYIETIYPEMLTGYLTFASFGDTASLNCDYIGLEEESAVPRTIEEIHGQGKKTLVWTVNDESSQKRFLLSRADRIITDEVSAAIRLREELGNRTDYEVVLDTFIK